MRKLLDTALCLVAVVVLVLWGLACWYTLYGWRMDVGL